MDFLHVFQQSFLYLCLFLPHEVFHLLLQSGILFNVLADGSGQVGCIVEERFQIFQSIFDGVHQFLYACTGVSFDTAYAGSNGAFRYNLYHTDVSGSGNVCTSTELNG